MAVLVDTSVWVDYLKSPHPTMLQLLGGDQVLMHPLVLGELALGNLAHRTTTLQDLRDLRSAAIADIAEVMTMIEARRLSGLGLGWVDINLLASTLIDPYARLWSRDKRLAAAAQRFERSFSPAH